MSLQVWLPLNGTLDNQGLAGDYVFTNSNTTDIVIDNNGKIGKCYSFSALSGKGIFSPDNGFMDKYINGKSSSVCYWVKTNVTNNCPLCLSYGYRVLINNNGKPSLSLYNSARYISVTGSRNICDNNWHHIATTYDNITGNMYIYIDGTKSGENNYGTDITYSSSWDNGLFIGRDPNNSTAISPYFFQGSLNDIRIYDHALSSKEVKEISKGLVLHYRLAGLGQENLITGNFSCTSTNTTYERQGTVGCVITAADLMANQGKTLTLSYDVYSLGDYTQNTTGTYQADRFGIHGCVKYTRTGASTSTQDYPLAGLLTRGKNGRVFTSWTIPTGITSFDTNLTFAIQTDGRAGFAYPASNNSSTWYLKNVKLEWGSVATPWVPNSTDTLYAAMGYNSNIEYDCSGFNNNATTSGKIEVSCDHYKYNNSYYFSDTSSYIKLPQYDYSGMSNSYTFSWWGKISSIASKMAWGFSNGNRLNVYPSTYFCWNTGDGGSNPFKNDAGTGVSYNSYSGDWHHFVVTGDGVNTKLYLDGTYAGKATTYRPLTGTQIYISGWDTSSYYKWIGNLSDFRIYSTALSADDIKELYEAGAHIDNHGNVYGYELKEE